MVVTSCIYAFFIGGVLAVCFNVRCQFRRRAINTDVNAWLVTGVVDRDTSCLTILYQLARLASAQNHVGRLQPSGQPIVLGSVFDLCHLVPPAGLF